MRTLTIDRETLYTLQDAAYMHATRLDAMATELLMTGSLHDKAAAEPFRQASQRIRDAITQSTTNARSES